LPRPLVITSKLYRFATDTKTYEEAATLYPWVGYFVQANATTTLVLDNGGEVTQGPEEPAGVSAQECAHGKYTMLCVSWELPSGGADGYNVYVYHDEEDFDSPVNGDRLVSVPRYTIGGLTPGEEYGIEVTGVKDDGGVLKESSHTARANRSTAAAAGSGSGRYASSRRPGRLAWLAPARSASRLGDGLEPVASATTKLISSSGTQAATSTTGEFGWG